VVELTKPTYTAVFERGREGFWEVELAEEPRVHTFGRTLAKARTHIREAAAVWFDVEEDAFEVAEELRLPKPVKDRLARALRGRERAELAKETALSLTREAAEALVRTSHLSTRDAADLLGLSPQRVQQVLAAAQQAEGQSRVAKNGT
jgi:predicted RNase H-like HicB family nuclease